MLVDLMYRNTLGPCSLLARPRLSQFIRKVMVMTSISSCRNRRYRIPMAGVVLEQLVEDGLLRRQIVRTQPCTTTLCSQKVRMIRELLILVQDGIYRQPGLTKILQNWTVVQMIPILSA